MKNDIGIEVCCDNCWFKCDCDSVVKKTCERNKKLLLFKPSTKAYKARIRELQEQQFTEEELQFIKRAVFEYSEMSDFDYKPILKKIEQTLKNLEVNLKLESKNNEQ